jgi:uncharacterized RDD family membrane protein YckC
MTSQQDDGSGQLPQYGGPANDQPTSSQPAYGQPQYGQPQYGQPQYGQAQYGQPQDPYGQAPGYGGPGYSPAPASPLASWGVRVVAYIVDFAPNIVLDAIGLSVENSSRAVYYICSLLGLAWVIYNRWIQGGKGQSLGKKVMHLRLIGEQTGQPIGTLMAFLRDIAHIVDTIICFVGYLFPLWDAKKQTLADKIVKTLVIQDGTR